MSNEQLVIGVTSINRHRQQHIIHHIAGIKNNTCNMVDNHSNFMQS